MSTFFVLIKNASDYYRFNYSEIIGDPDVIYLDNPVARYPSFIRKIHRLHNSKLINKYVHLPFKQIWFPLYLRGIKIPSSDVCFVIDASPLYLTTYMYDYVLYLKKKYPTGRFVLFYQDLIGLCPRKYRPDKMKNIFDLIISYDKSEAKKYNILYHPTVGSKIFVNNFEGIPSCDVYLLAKAKNRLPIIIEAYDSLSKQGLKCDFYITEVNLSKRISRPGIHYLGCPMNYKDNICHVINSKCILELVQDNSVGYSLRLWEAILYDKIFLTNNLEMYNSEFYDNKYVSIISSMDDMSIHANFINSSGEYTNPLKALIGPRSLLRFIEKQL